MSKLSNTAEDILGSARVLIAAGGYNGFSYADIAEVVGIKKASIHHHFPSKVDLVRALVSQYRAAIRDGLANLEHGIASPAEQLRAYVRYWETCIGDASAPFCICALLASELPILPEEVALEVRTHFRTLSAWMAGVLERGQQQGVMKLARTPQVEAEIFMAAVHGAMLSSRAYGEPAMFSAIMTPQLDQLTTI
ncbi:TetR family transcriptional regulator [Pseudoduganella sp. FT25W]|uniref:TetR family transcriptional regulator n=1 Tax=Duganella alba TaxID=2666081 RepID=A0A6L5QJW3_9BURK|nr:TetR/AcrR family transcriptional regulator [Duganella alba]MRX10066.1 TetR family transcriptional regulator [Duganella alba]MRX17739.1 TetR family transcriptional regulator [Duganella alba]